MFRQIYQLRCFKNREYQISKLCEHLNCKIDLDLSRKDPPPFTYLEKNLSLPPHVSRKYHRLHKPGIDPLHS